MSDNIGETKMTDIDKLRSVLIELSVPFTIRAIVAESGDMYEYLFIGNPEDAINLLSLDDNFEKTDLDSLLVRHKFFEFENGELASFTSS